MQRFGDNALHKLTFHITLNYGRVVLSVIFDVINEDVKKYVKLNCKILLFSRLNLSKGVDGRWLQWLQLFIEYGVVCVLLSNSSSRRCIVICKMYAVPVQMCVDRSLYLRQVALWWLLWLFRLQRRAQLWWVNSVSSAHMFCNCFVHRRPGSAIDYYCSKVAVSHKLQHKHVTVTFLMLDL